MCGCGYFQGPGTAAKLLIQALDICNNLTLRETEHGSEYIYSDITLKSEDYNIKMTDTVVKPHINLIVIGDAGSGKSTISAQLLFETGAVTAQVMEQAEKEADEMDKAGYKYAWVLDTLKEEREQGRTIVLHHRRFQTDGLDVTLIDAPGHKNLGKKVILGATQADCALLVVSAPQSEMEAGMSVDGQTLEHLQMAYTMNVKQVVVVVNKMDLTNPVYSEARFDAVKRKLSAHLKHVGYKLETVPFIPVSGWHNENLAEISSYTPWFSGWEVSVKGKDISGKTLLDAIEAMRPPKRPIDSKLRMPIEKIFNMEGLGDILVGRIEYGTLATGDEVLVSPGDTTGTVVSIERHHEKLDNAIPGHTIGLRLQDVAGGTVRRGCVCSHPDRGPAVEVEEFVAQVFITLHPTTIRPGYSPVVHCHTARVACQLVEILEMTDRYGRNKVENPPTIQTGNIAVVRMKPLKSMVVESFSEYPALARIVLRDSNSTLGVGMIKSITVRNN